MKYLFRLYIYELYKTVLKNTNYINDPASADRGLIFIHTNIIAYIYIYDRLSFAT